MNIEYGGPWIELPRGEDGNLLKVYVEGLNSKIELPQGLDGEGLTAFIDNLGRKSAWIPLDEHAVTPASGAAYDVSEHSQDYRTGYAEALQAVLDRIRVSGKQDLAGWVDQQLKTWKP